MQGELKVRLKCCGKDQTVEFDKQGILAKKPNDIRKNILCSVCNRLVILEFGLMETGIAILKQEVVEFNRLNA